MGFHEDDEDPDQDMTARKPRHAARVPDGIADGIQKRLVAMRARHVANQHGCRARETGTCDDPEHRRDLDLLGEFLDAMGLSHDYPAYTQAEERTLLRWIGQSGPPEDIAA